MKERFLIVEDDAILAYSLSIILEGNGYEVIEIANNVKEAYKLCKMHSPDIVLVDVCLIGIKTGIDLAHKLKENNVPCSVIYLTAFKDAETINKIKETDPILYLTKPFISEVLLTNIELVLTQLKNTNITIPIEDGSSSTMVNVLDINYLQSDRNYVNIKLKDGSELVVRNKLNDIENLIFNKTTRFTRIHQSYLVNDNFIQSVKKNSVLLKNDLSITISKKYLNSFQSKWIHPEIEQ
ncbi:MAG: LytR/AlgR family response regulator transcription factor [Flavobacteriales bacterium]